MIIASVLLASRLNLDPGSWISWIIVGLISGAIAARVVAGRGFGCIADIVVGVAGAIIGGYLLGAIFHMDRRVLRQHPRRVYRSRGAAGGAEAALGRPAMNLSLQLQPS